MAIDRVKFQNIVSSQVPTYIREDFPLLVNFLEEYYVSQEYQGGSYDLINNLDQYVKVDELTNLKTSTTLSQDLNEFDTSIITSSNNNFTYGFPDTNGLIQIDDEIITYATKTQTTFEGCVRGFSGITSYFGSDSPDKLVFQQSIAASHSAGAEIKNLNIIFLQEFFKKLKNQVIPGFDERKLASDLDQKNFILNSDSFYKSKGTDSSFKILFRALYNKDVEVIKPSQFLFKPSDADYIVSQDFVLEAYQGDPEKLKNLTLYQRKTGARGTISNIERIPYSDGFYYQTSIDYGYQRDIDVDGTIYGKFEPNPKTKLVSNVSIGSTILDVDSTVSFDKSGELSIIDVDGNEVILNYTDKNLTQFLGVTTTTSSISAQSDVRDSDYSYGYVGLGTDEEVRVKVTSTLTNFNILSDNYLYSKNDKITIKSLGIESEDLYTENWYYNIKTKWNVNSIELIDSTENIYSIITFDNNFFKEGYNITLSDSTNKETLGTVVYIDSVNRLRVKLDIPIESSRLNLKYTIQNQILKGVSDNYPKIRNSYSNILNNYRKFDDSLLVASTSIPRFDDSSLNPYDKKVSFSGSANGDTILLTPNSDHGFYTGDSIFYRPGTFNVTEFVAGYPYEREVTSGFENLDSIVYFVRRVDSSSIKLATSKTNLFQEKYITPTGVTTNSEFIYFDFYQKEPDAQKIYREFIKPVNESGNYETSPGYNALFVNGVESLNYKSKDKVIYGSIIDVNINNGGYGYDVINPPLVKITDEIGYGATGTCGVEGELEEIRIVDSGFDFVDNPIVEISGGNGKDAAASVQLSKIEHLVSFNAERGSNSGINTNSNQIGFTTFHKFRDNEKIVYVTNNLKSVSGIVTNSVYYARIIDDSTITLHNFELDANSGINTVSLTDFGVGVQQFKSFEDKNIVSSIVVTNRGKNYANKKNNISSSGINTASNQVLISNHGYKDGDIVRYTPNSSPILGLSSNTDYFVNFVNDSSFTLSLVGVASTNVDYYKNNNILVNIESIGGGSFNYKPIEVSVKGTIGVSTFSNQDFSCKVQPIFRGSVTSVNLSNGGVGYGVSEILNFDRQPVIELISSGSVASVTPVIQNGRIIEVVIDNGGTEYNSPPDLVISGVGSFAQLTPIVENGSLVDVVVVSGGINYDNGTSINVISAGAGCDSVAVINEWTVNLFQRNFNSVNDNDSFLDNNITNTSLELSYLYPARKLRENVNSLLSNGEVNYGNADLIKVNNIEVDSSFHSPIIGWAYDGNPIYGPYGFANAFGGSPRQMISGYELSNESENRPPFNIFEPGFFVEDYTFTSNGDLDIHNGRFCVTPDFPNGTYAYFTTFNQDVDNNGPFTNYKRPAFPYVVGNSFYSVPNGFNFDGNSNQIDYDIESDEWFRNTEPYHINDENSGYDFIFNSNDFSKQSLDITGSSFGNVQSVGILTGGSNYQVGDQIIFDNQGSGGRGARAKVSEILGKSVSSVSVATTYIYDIEFIPSINRNEFIGISSIPNDLENEQTIQVQGLSEVLYGFDESYVIGLRSDRFTLRSNVENISNTGLVTYFDIAGNINENSILPNDILSVNEEKVKVLNIDNKNQRVRVSREYDSTTGSAHTSLSLVIQDSRKFNINVGSIRTTRNFRFNNELYFDPSEAVGVGSTGVKTQIVFSNPGAGITELTISNQQIYIPNHGLKLNDNLFYSTNYGESLTVWNGQTGTGTTSLSGFSSFYAAPFNNNFIGISTNIVGLGTTGYFEGINNSAGLFYFIGIGTGVKHSFRTNLKNTLVGQIQRNQVTVSTGDTHGLSINDTVDFRLKPRNTINITVKYDDFNRRIVFDPKDFSSSDVDVSNNTIRFTNNKFITGDKVIHTSTSSSGGLINEGMYYVYRFNEDEIRLVLEKSEIESDDPNFVDITSASTGTLSKINPLINCSRNNIVKFDLSDGSLSFTSNNGEIYSAFDLQIFTDSEFQTRFLTSELNNSFEVVSVGRIGIDSDAYLQLSVSDFIPEILWYSFQPINQSFAPSLKREILIDRDVKSFNQFNVVKSEYDGVYKVSGLGTNSFKFDLESIPETTSFNSSNSKIEYSTNSLTAFGSINNIDVYGGGYGYKSLPGISTIKSRFGVNSILNVQSKNIGEILSYNYTSNNIGFDYPTDRTLNVVADLPDIIQIEPLNEFKRIGIASQGINYVFAPNLVVVDTFTNEVIDDVQLNYELGDTEVTIIKNTSGINNSIPRIIPIDNTNGIGINTITYNNSNQTVRVFFDNIFNDDSEFPFTINSKVMVEGINIGVGSTGLGYNSEDYNYAYFTVTGVNTNPGGFGGYIDYSLSDYLKTNELPGNFTEPIYGYVTPVSYLPIFLPELQIKNFFVGEKITNGRTTGRVDSWESKIETAKVSRNIDFKKGDIVKGLSSNTQGRVRSLIDADGQINIGSGTTVVKGWQRNTGFFNDNLQRIPNNEYYQNFSYSLKSEVPFDEWNSTVGSLNHTAGFQKYSDLQIISISDTALVENIDQSLTTIVDIVTETDLNCVFDFDNVSESSFFVNGRIFSNEIFFENRILASNFQSIGNRVLSVDDLSKLFRSGGERSEPGEAISEFPSNYMMNKMLTLAKDTVFVNERQLAFCNVLQYLGEGVITQYGTIETEQYLGGYEYGTADDGRWSLDFYPVKFQDNIYNVTTFALSNLGDITTTGTVQFGDFAIFESFDTNIAAATTTTIVSVASSYKALKISSLIQGTNSNLYGSEINVIHDGTDAFITEYGALDFGAPLGFGTYNARVSGGNIIVEFIPSVGYALTCKSSVLSISDASSTIGARSLNVTRIGTAYSTFTSGASPVAVSVDSYSPPIESVYHITMVKDVTNNEFGIYETGSIRADSSQAFVNFGNIETSGIGTIGTRISPSNSTNTELLFTPNPNTEVEVRTLSFQLEIFDGNARPSEIDNGSSDMRTGQGQYEGTRLTTVSSFELLHKGSPIFEKTFDATDSNIVKIESNTVTIPNHFLVTGEFVTYTSPGTGNTASIGIETATIPGIGQTDILPSEVYIIKQDDANIRFAATPTDALALVPVPLVITSVGTGGTEHTITSKDQNAKGLFTIDNIIQSPVSNTVITSSLSETISFDVSFNTTGITSFKTGDLIKIDDEIMLIRNVGVESPNEMTVLRGQLGTELVTHSSGSTITKLSGDYNIVKNKIHFSSAPYGLTPTSDDDNEPDSRDWVGISTSSTFQGRTFMKTGNVGASTDTYYNNYVLDDISAQFTGLKSDFVLQSGTENVIGIETSTIILINNIFQEPQGEQLNIADYENIFDSDVGITTIKFTGGDSSPKGYDPNQGQLPIGGLIVSIGQSEGIGYQPLVAAGGSVTVSGLGTIQSVSIGNSGSGYRSGIQTFVNVGVQTYSGGIPNIEFIGTATIDGGHIVSIAITNPGTGYTSSNPPALVIDEPLSYSNIPLIYSDSGAQGNGQGATVDIQVGSSTSVFSFAMNKQGYGYGNNEILTVEIGGTTGIPTTGSNFREFQLTVDNIFNDNFSGWSLGEFQVLDNFDSEFNGSKTVFQLKVSEQAVAIEKRRGSPIELDQLLLIFINDVLQEPGRAYKFERGTKITFTDPPDAGDTSKVLFYKGNANSDVVFVDVFDSVKSGDTLDININSSIGQQPDLDQNPRVVYSLLTSDSVETNNYGGPGIRSDQSILRPVTWCRQTSDLFINGSAISKDRINYEPQIYPASVLLQSVSISTETIYVNNVRPLFDSNNESNSRNFQNSIVITSQDSIVGASGTAIVSIAGTISSIDITGGGVGYAGTTAAVSISVGVGTTVPARGIANISNGSVTSVTITNPGSGYTSSSVPVVLFETPAAIIEKIGVEQYTGDYATVVGLGTTNSGSQDQIFIDTFIPKDSFMRDSEYVGTGITVSGIGTGDYFTMFDTFISIASTFASESVGGETIGIGTTCLDNVYQVQDVETLISNVNGVGNTAVVRIKTNIDSYRDGFIYVNGDSLGEFSWGRIGLSSRSDPKEFTFYGNDGYVGIETSGLVTRTNSLKFNNYTS